MNSLNETEIKKARIDTKKAYEKKLIIDDDKSNYLKVQTMYKKVFDKYIDELFNINEKIDKSMKKSKLDYGKMPENKQSIYQKFSSLNSDYIFVRNFFYVERLEDEEINIFLEDEEINKKKIEIVKNTFKRVIRAGSEEKVRKIFYGIPVPIYEFDNDSLVLYLDYWKNTVKLHGDEFINNKLKKEEYLDKITKELEEEMQEKLECKVNIRYFKGIVA